MTITTTAYSVSDDFTTNTSASYTSSANDGGSAGTWNFDTANARVVGSAGSDAALTYTGLSYLNGYTEIQTDQMDNGGITFRRSDNNNMFACYVNDSAAASPNRIQIWIINAGGYVLLGSTTSISFTRGTQHTIRLMVCHRQATVFFDGQVVLCASYSGDLPAGSGGLDTGSATNHFQKLTIVNLEAAPLNPTSYRPTDGFGIYEQYDVTSPTALTRLQTIAKAGFKLVLNYALCGEGGVGTPHIADVVAYINYAATLGMKVIVSLKGLDIWQTPAIAAGYPNLYADSGNQATTSGFDTYIVNQTKNLVGTWGYYGADEPSNADHTALHNHYNYIKAATSLPVFVVMPGQYTSDGWNSFSTLAIDSCDVGGDDWYPLGSSVGVPTTVELTNNIAAYASLNGNQQAVALQAMAQNGATPAYADLQGWVQTVGTYMQPRIVLFFWYPSVLSSPNPTQLWHDLTAVIAPTPRPQLPRYIPRGLGATIIPDPVSQPLAYVRRPLGATIVNENRTFIPRAFGGIYIPDTVLWVPRALGSTTPDIAALAATFAGVGILAGTLQTSGGIALAVTFSGNSTDTGTLNAQTALTAECDGIGQLTTTLSATFALTSTLAGVGGCVGGLLAGGVTALSLYGSNVAAGAVTTTGKCAVVTGGTEVTAVTTAPASGSGYVECFALGGVSTVNASLPAPSGKGWTLDSTLLEGQRLVAGNWIASVPVSDANGGGPVTSYTLRFWQRSSGGTYAFLGSLVLSASQTISTLRVVKTFPAGAMPQTDFAVGDELYLDFFINANGWASDVLSVYVSNSGTAGVAGDLEIDTAGYIPSGMAGVVTSYIERALSALLVVTSTALLDTLSGTGQLTGAISTLSAAFALTFSGGGVLSGQLTANLALPATTLAGASSLSGLPSLATSLATSQFAGSSTLAASILARTVLTGQLAGVGTLASSFQLATSVAGQFAGIDAFSATMMANLALPGVVLTGRGTLSGTLSTSTLTPVALVATMAGLGTLVGALALTTQLIGTPAGTSTLSATMTASTTLAGTTLAGNGVLIGATARGAALSTTTLIGVGTLGGSLSAALTLSGASLPGVGILSGTLTGAGGLVGTLSGGSTLAGSLSAALQLSGVSLAGGGVLSATVQASTALGATLASGSTLSGVPGARTALGATLTGSSTLTGGTALTTTLTGMVPGAGTLAGAVGRSTTLSVALVSSGQLAAVGSAQTALTSSFAGGGTAAFTLFLRTSLSITLSGAGSVTTASVSYQAALALTLSGLASLSGSLTVPVLAYLSATWVTRDGQAVWKTRDEQEATWVTRDGQAVWKIRS